MHYFYVERNTETENCLWEQIATNKVNFSYKQEIPVIYGHVTYLPRNAQVLRENGLILCDITDLGECLLSRHLSVPFFDEIYAKNRVNRLVREIKGKQND
jgi:hypothetical protein